MRDDRVCFQGDGNIFWRSDYRNSIFLNLGITGNETACLEDLVDSCGFAEADTNQPKLNLPQDNNSH